MHSNHKTFGDEGEALAVDFLEAQGYRIIETNYRVSLGEIDIIAQEGQRLCFVEVKTRRSDQKGTAKEAVTYSKQRKLVSLAQWYLKERFQNRVNIPSRFDVVAIDYNEENLPQLQLIRNAFGA